MALGPERLLEGERMRGAPVHDGGGHIERGVRKPHFIPGNDVNTACSSFKTTEPLSPFPFAVLPANSCESSYSHFQILI